MSMLLRRYHKPTVKGGAKASPKVKAVEKAVPSPEKPKAVTETAPSSAKQYTREEISKKGFAQLKNIAKREGLDVNGMFADEIKELLYTHYGV